MKYENWISYRYLMATKGRFLTFLNFISIAGVAIGVASLIVVISVMTGFGNNLREKIIGTTPHIMIEKETGVKNYEEIRKKLSTVKGVMASSPYIQGNLFLESSGQALGIMVRGINPETEKNITKVNKYLVKGSIDNLIEDTVIVGSELARYFGYDLGDTITLIAPGSGIEGKGWRYKLKIVGVFNTGMADFDMNLVLINLNKAQQIFGYEPGMSTGIGVKVEDAYQAREIKKQLYGILGYEYLIKSWIDINRNLFEALFLEKWGLFLILTMMVLVASFNIISTLIVTVSSKVHDIGILKSIGVPKQSIRKIFTKQGLMIGVLGTFWGFIAGMVICFILKTYIRVPKEIYSMDHVPVDVQITDVAVILSSALIISFLATIYPAAKAANLQPVEALRYE